MAIRPTPTTQKDPRPLPSITDRLVTGMLMILEKTRTRPWRRMGIGDKGSLQNSVLRFLADTPGQRAIVNHIAAGTGTRPPTATQVINVLCHKGLVTKRKDLHDHRLTVVTLSPAGRKTVKQPASWDQAILGAYQGLTEIERARLLRYVTVLETNALPPALPPRTDSKRVIQYLSNPNHYPATIAGIRTALQMKASVLRKALTTLKQRGWLTQTADPSQVRRHRLELSPSGVRYANTEGLIAGRESRPEKSHQAGT